MKIVKVILSIIIGLIILRVALFSILRDSLTWTGLGLIIFIFMIFTPRQSWVWVIKLFPVYMLFLFISVGLLPVVPAVPVMAGIYASIFAIKKIRTK